MGLGILDPTAVAILGYIIVALWLFSVVLVLVLIFYERADPKSIALWMAVMLLFPAIGLFIYLCFGMSFYRQRNFALKNLSDEQMAEIVQDAVDVLDNETDSADSEEIRLLRTLTAASGSLYSVNNDIKLFTEGDKFFESLFKDLRNAKVFINAEYYIIRNDKLSNEFMDILIEKAKAGVEVRLMVDAIGFNSGPKKRIKELKKAGGKFKLFHRVITVLLSPKKNNRNHRKIAVIDGTIGYVSGYNIGDEYEGKGEMGFWRDSGVRVEGTGVVPMNLRFFMDWAYAYGEKIDAGSKEVLKKYFPADDCTQYGLDVMQLISGGPDTKSNPIELQYLNMIYAAKNRLYIHTPYLVPSDNIKKALIAAACSGTDVRIIMPDKPDHLFVFWVSILNAGELMDHGVRIFQYKRGFVHSKSIVVDGVYSSVGSANLDQRSMTLNFETNVLIYSEKIAKQMEDVFLEDLEYCEEYTLEEFRKLGRWENFKISVARLFSSLA